MFIKLGVKHDKGQLNKCKVYLFLGRGTHKNVIQVLPIFLLNLSNLFL